MRYSVVTVLTKRKQLNALELFRGASLSPSSSSASSISPQASMYRFEFLPSSKIVVFFFLGLFPQNRGGVLLLSTSSCVFLSLLLMEYAIMSFQTLPLFVCANSVFPFFFTSIYYYKMTYLDGHTNIYKFCFTRVISPYIAHVNDVTKKKRLHQNVNQQSCNIFIKQS